MEYKAVPFEPLIDRSRATEGVSRDLQALIDREVASGWDFVGIQNHSTVIPGSSGCFGIGASPPYPKTMSIVVFGK